MIIKLRFTSFYDLYSATAPNWKAEELLCIAAMLRKMYISKAFI